MKIIILEGPSTSGKTTVAKLLSDKLLLTGFSVRYVTEDETLMPILSEKDFQVHLKHLNSLLSGLDNKVDFVVADRFHLTSAAVTNTSISEFNVLENSLIKYDPLIVFLEIDEEKLGERVFEAMKHRGPSWKAHVESKGSKEDIINWYKQTQINLLTLLKNSIISYKLIDATNSNYDNISEQIFNAICNNKN